MQEPSKQIGGMRVDAPRYNDGLREVAATLIEAMRGVVELPKDAERGSLFNSTPGLIWRIESSFDAADFAMNPIAAIEWALIDAAQSDYWYSHEKDWGDSVDLEEWDTDAC